MVSIPSRLSHENHLGTLTGWNRDASVALKSAPPKDLTMEPVDTSHIVTLPSWSLASTWRRSVSTAWSTMAAKVTATTAYISAWIHNPFENNGKMNSQSAGLTEQLNHGQSPEFMNQRIVWVTNPIQIECQPCTNPKSCYISTYYLVKTISCIWNSLNLCPYVALLLSLLQVCFARAPGPWPPLMTADCLNSLRTAGLKFPKT